MNIVLALNIIWRDNKLIPPIDVGQDIISSPLKIPL